MHMHDGEAQRERDLKMTQSKPFDGQIQYFKGIFSLMTLMLRWAEPGALTKLEGPRGERIRKQSSSEDSTLD